MAKKKAATVQTTTETEEETGASTALEEVEDELEESMALDLQAALAECGDSGQVRVQLIKTHPKDEAGACTTYDSAELTIDRVREEYGAGKYHLMFRNSRGQLLTRKHLSIVAKRVAPTATPASADIAKLLEGTATSNTNNQFLMMMKMMELSGQQMVALINRPQPAPPPPPPAPPPFGPSEMVALMTGLASIMKPAKDNESPIDAMLKGVKLVKELQGDGDGDNSIVSTISKGIDMVAPLLSQRQPALPAPPSQLTVTQVRTAPAEASVQTPVAVPAPEPTYKGDSPEENDMFAKLVWIRGQLERLVEKARLGRDPELYADLFLDELPSFVNTADIETALLDAAWFDRLKSMNAAVAEFHAWFEEFRQAIADRLEEAEQERQQLAKQKGAENNTDPPPAT